MEGFQLDRKLRACSGSGQVFTMMVAFQLRDINAVALRTEEREGRKSHLVSCCVGLHDNDRRIEAELCCIALRSR